MLMCLSFIWLQQSAPGGEERDARRHSTVAVRLRGKMDEGMSCQIYNNKAAKLR